MCQRLLSRHVDIPEDYSVILLETQYRNLLGVEDWKKKRRRVTRVAVLGVYISTMRRFHMMDCEMISFNCMFIIFMLPVSIK